MPSPTAARIHRRTSVAIDVIRGVSAQAVVAGHAMALVFTVKAAEGSPWALQFLTQWAHPAVIAFFVVSGYLVGGRVWRDIRSGRFGGRSYALSRLTRLYVVLIPGVVITLAADALAFGAFHGTAAFNNRAVFFVNQGHAMHTHWAWSPWTVLGNLGFVQTIVAPRLGTNVALWSLANEFWYYVLFPALLIAFFGRGRSRVLAGVVSVAVIVLLASSWRPSGPPFALQFLVYFGVWLLGVVAAQLDASRWRDAAVGGLIGSVVILAAVRHRTGFPPDLAMAAVTFFAIVSAESLPITGLRRPAAALASYSYSLYVIHVPILFLALSAASWRPLGYSAHGLAVLIGIILVANVAAIVFYNLAERRTPAVRAVLTKRRAAALVG